jgi:Tfp pilus assembly protein PilX
MDKVVAEALRAVAEAEAALADAETQLRRAWAERLAAFQQAGLTVAFVHEHRAERISQRIVIVDGDRTVDIAKLTAEAVA